MGLDRDKLVQTVWAVLLTAMGVLLLFKTPYAIRAGNDNTFLQFARYFIGAFLIVGGIRKFFSLYLAGRKTDSPED
jgi:hypothetical protein